MSNVMPFAFASIDDEARILQDVVDSTWRALESGVTGIKNFPIFLGECLEKRVWEHERVFPGGSRHAPVSFHDFIHEEYPVGLGATYERIEGLIRDDNALLLLWTEATKRPAGGANNPNRDAETGRLLPKGNALNVNNVNVEVELPERPQGNSAEAGLRRLHAAATPIIDKQTGEIIRDADPKAADLLKRVEAKDISVNAACIEMGWRKKTITVPDNVEALSDHAAKRWGALASIRRLLTKLTYDERCQVRFWLDELDAANRENRQ